MDGHQVELKMKNQDLFLLEQSLYYKFNDKTLLEEAIRHSSYVNEHPDEGLRDNECFEFLGDAVLSLVIGHILMRRYPDLKEGDLSRMRADLVNESQLAKIARFIDLGSYIKLGKGELLTDGHKKKSILADSFEALLAAVYLDGGFDAAFKTIERHFSDLLDSVAESTAITDYKSRLQELVQLKCKAVPLYSVINVSGPDHDKTFKVLIDVCNIQTQGSGKSKKTAEQNAAEKALKILAKEFDLCG